MLLIIISTRKAQDYFMAEWSGQAEVVQKQSSQAEVVQERSSQAAEVV